jgi:excisionase family DNA binding protein
MTETDLLQAILATLQAMHRAAKPRGALTIEDAATYLSLSRSRLYEMVDTGEIAAIHSGRAVRIPVSELDAWIEQQLTEERSRCSAVRRGKARSTSARTAGSSRR